MDAYKGFGSYFTMKNMILFHNCNIHLPSGEALDRDSSFTYIRTIAENSATTGQQMFDEMMRLIKDNDFDYRG